MVQIKLQLGEGYIPDLVARMEKYRISQNALAREMGKNPSQVSRWFTPNLARRVMPEMETVIKIEEAVERLRHKKARL